MRIVINDLFLTEFHCISFIILFIQFLFYFLWLCLGATLRSAKKGLTLSFVLQNHSWWDMGHHIECQRSTELAICKAYSVKSLQPLIFLLIFVKILKYFKQIRNISDMSLNLRHYKLTQIKILEDMDWVNIDLFSTCTYSFLRKFHNNSWKFIK